MQMQFSNTTIISRKCANVRGVCTILAFFFPWCVCVFFFFSISLFLFSRNTQGNDNRLSNWIKGYRSHSNGTKQWQERSEKRISPFTRSHSKGDLRVPKPTKSITFFVRVGVLFLKVRSFVNVMPLRLVYTISRTDTPLATSNDIFCARGTTTAVANDIASNEALVVFGYERF